MVYKSGSIKIHTPKALVYRALYRKYQHNFHSIADMYGVTIATVIRSMKASDKMLINQTVSGLQYMAAEALAARKLFPSDYPTH